jgi:hypothetical protein
VVTHSSADYLVRGGHVIRRERPPRTRGLNRNHNRIVKDVFKGAATAATARAGVLHDFYQRLISQGMRPELARVTLARKLAALTRHLWKRGERFDPTQLSTPAHSTGS